MAARNVWISVCLSMFFAFGGCKPFECAAPQQSDNITVITTACQLINILNNLEWPDNDSMLPTTDDIEIQGTVTIKSFQLKYLDKNTDACIPYNKCPLFFENDHGGEGIEIVNGYESLRNSVSTLRLTNVRLRFRTVRAWLGPASWAPEIILLLPSDQSCKAGELRCAKDNVCYPWITDYSFDYWESYCLSCENLTREECICRNDDGIFPDNTTCHYPASPDFFPPGQCRGGVCISEE